MPWGASGEKESRGPVSTQIPPMEQIGSNLFAARPVAEPFSHDQGDQEQRSHIALRLYKCLFTWNGKILGSLGADVRESSDVRERM